MTSADSAFFRSDLLETCFAHRQARRVPFRLVGVKGVPSVFLQPFSPYRQRGRLDLEDTVQAT